MRERERESGYSIYWIRDIDKIFKSNKIKNERKTYVISFGIDILKESAILANHTPFSIYNYNIKKEKLEEKNNNFYLIS